MCAMLNKPKSENLFGKFSGNEYEDFQTILDKIKYSLETLEEEFSENIERIKSDIKKIEQEKQNNLTFDETPTENSNNPVKSKGIKAFVETQITNGITKPRETITETSPIFSPTANTIYTCENGLTGLSLTDIPNSQDETLIYFHTEGDFTVNIPNGTKYINDLVVLAGYHYVISILNGILIIAPCTVNQ